MRQNDKRSPLKQKPLRLPGESLEDERDRIFDDELLSVFIAALFALIFGLLEWLRWLTKASPQPLLATVAAVGVITYCAYRFFKIRPRLASLKLGIEGEKAVGQFLDSHRGPDWRVFHDVIGPGFNVDHVVVSPRGVFAIETKTRSKPAKGEAVVKYDGKTVLVDGQASPRDPIVQARAERAWIRDLLLETTGITYPVRGVVLFPGWFVDSSRSGRPDIWVLNEKAFVKWVENGPAVIKNEDVSLAAARLVNYITN